MCPLPSFFTTPHIKWNHVLHIGVREYVKIGLGPVLNKYHTVELLCTNLGNLPLNDTPSDPRIYPNPRRTQHLIECKTFQLRRQPLQTHTPPPHWMAEQMPPYHHSHWWRPRSPYHCYNETKFSVQRARRLLATSANFAPVSIVALSGASIALCFCDI